MDKKASLLGGIELDDLKNSSKSRTTSAGETLIHLLKGNVGSGCFAIPAAFKNSGLWLGVVGIPILGGICLHAMHLILESAEELQRRSNLKAIGYEEAAELSFKLGPKAARKWSSTMSYCITTFLIITQMGFCCVYFVFTSQNLYQAIECMTGGTDLNQFHYMALLLAPALLMCYIPDLKLLAPLSLIAATVELVGIICIFYYTIRDLPTTQTEIEAFGSWTTLPLFFAAAIFSFEGIGLILPLRAAMKRPQYFPGTFGVLNTGLFLTILLYSAFGFFGYLYYGNNIMGSITLNLPGDELLANLVKIFVGSAIFLAYPLQMYVPFSVLMPGVLRRFSKPKEKIIVEYIMRTVMVLITFILAIAIPNIGLFINLVGAVSASTLALIFPPIIDIMTFWPHTGKYNWKLVKNLLVMLIGFLGFLTGTYTSLQEIIKFFQEGQPHVSPGC